MTRVLQPLRQQGIDLSFYLDDICVLAKSRLGNTPWSDPSSTSSELRMFAQRDQMLLETATDSTISWFHSGYQEDGNTFASRQSSKSQEAHEDPHTYGDHNFTEVGSIRRTPESDLQRGISGSTLYHADVTTAPQRARPPGEYSPQLELEDSCNGGLQESSQMVARTYPLLKRPIDGSREPRYYTRNGRQRLWMGLCRPRRGWSFTRRWPRAMESHQTHQLHQLARTTSSRPRSRSSRHVLGGLDNSGQDRQYHNMCDNQSSGQPPILAPAGASKSPGVFEQCVEDSSTCNLPSRNRQYSCGPTQSQGSASPTRNAAASERLSAGPTALWPTISGPVRQPEQSASCDLLFAASRPEGSGNGCNVPTVETRCIRLSPNGSS